MTRPRLTYAGRMALQALATVAFVAVVILNVIVVVEALSR